jgi:hypothetical protein
MIIDIILGVAVVILLLSHIQLAKATGKRTSNQQRYIKLAHHRLDKLEK